MQKKTIPNFSFVRCGAVAMVSMGCIPPYFVVFPAAHNREPGRPRSPEATQWVVGFRRRPPARRGPPVRQESRLWWRGGPKHPHAEMFDACPNPLDGLTVLGYEWGERVSLSPCGDTRNPTWAEAPELCANPSGLKTPSLSADSHRRNAPSVSWRKDERCGSSLEFPSGSSRRTTGTARHRSPRMPRGTGMSGPSTAVWRGWKSWRICR